MSEVDLLAGAVRRLCRGFHAEAVTLAAELLNAAQSAHDVLAPVADDESPLGDAARIALIILADAIASASPPEKQAC